MNKAISATFLYLLLSAISIAAPIDDGSAAYKSGNYSEAYKFFKLAADQGNAGAMNNLAAFYMNGLGVSRDYSQGIKWLKMAGENGFVSAQVNLGQIYSKGEYDQKKDYPQALKWFKMAAAQGDPRGEFLLGLMYWDGLGTRKNLEEAKKLLNAAVKHGEKDAKDALIELERESSQRKTSSSSVDPIKEILSPTKNPDIYPYEAVVSCLIFGTTPSMPEACFSDRLGGTQLEVRSGQDYQMYTAFNLLSAGSYTNEGLVIKLHKDFVINAQNADENMILNIKIRNSKTGAIIYQKSAGQYGYIRIRN
ncbi:tetratricopeptide repeat protein [Polynucleobacter sp. UK-Gri1-W3]|uniref:tetratricopeptide repeat protein n=1 Tax=Polynucleobacter sp. UK-Gri1-W3 TaxID=1819737 RepID=UPI001C0C5BDA|nr:tetratricopeptide repeat protein [Polynucleobacter sp. UK-Gri1-W3]MBU3537931.1 sel1 repeat family protein [Polynucleobacter sp. UK-Gri1-W3]